ncbi:MAG: adenylyltransferase/cytidyltransferase family protein [Chlamydiales bacterium]|nr:adenylyltransferase/cytidyltransferase family protein [Chlamydiales bacterium]
MSKAVWPSFTRNKIIDPSSIGDVVATIKKQKKTIVTLNGSFDLLHAGHLMMIHEAKKQGDTLIMALNSDESIKQYKSSQRPIIPLEFRLQMMSALADVDYVTWFHELDPRELLGIIKPDVHVNGAEYGENCIEAQVVKNGGGRLHLISRIETLSTTNIIKKIQSLCD